MKNTGIIRRIDELGRVVIPKEIRKVLGIRDGENLEIFVDDNKIVLKKHLIMQSLVDLSNQMIIICSSVLDSKLLITDREKIISTSDTYSYLINQKINVELLKLIDNRESLINEEETKITFDQHDLFGRFIIVPIISETDCLGLVICLRSESNTKSEELKITKLIANMLSEKLNLN